MKSSTFTAIIFFLICTLCISNSYAQEEEKEEDDCLITLKKVQREYEEGLIENIPNNLANCIKDGLSGEDKIAAYKLLINVYLFDDRIQLAEETMIKLLNYEPEMQPNAAIDSKEFITLFNSYRTIPLYTLGITAGINYSHPYLIKQFGTNNTDIHEGEYSVPEFGFHVGLNASYLIKKNLYVNLDVLYTGQKFSYGTELNSYSTLKFNESQSTIHSPLSLSYQVGKKKVRPYVKLGGYGNFNFSSKSEFIRSYTNNAQTNITGPLISITNMRNKLTYGVTGSLGAKYKVKEAYFFIEASYAYSLKQTVNPSERYSNNELIYEYQYVDDDFKVSNIFISVGFKKLFYKPKKKKLTHE